MTGVGGSAAIYLKFPLLFDYNNVLKYCLLFSSKFLLQLLTNNLVNRSSILTGFLLILDHSNHSGGC